MKALEQYFSVVLCKMNSVDEILKCDIQMKVTKQYFSVVLFIMMYKVVQTFESMDGPLLLRNVKKIKTMVGHVML